MKNFKILGLVLASLFFLLLGSLRAESEEEQAYKKGLDLYRKGKYTEALPWLKRATHWQKDTQWKNKRNEILWGEKKLHTMNWQACQLLGNVFYKLGDKEEALKAYQESLDIYPDNPKLASVVNQMRGIPDPTPTPAPVFQEVNPTPEQGLPGADDPENAKVHELPVSLLK